MILRPDCRHFAGDRPCRFNKEYGQTCPECPHYQTRGPRILIVKLAALGDVLRTTSILPAVKRQWPGSYIVWLTERAAMPLLKGNPLIDEIWSVEEEAGNRLLCEEFHLALNSDADRRTAALVSIAKARERRGMTLDHCGSVRPASPDAEQWLEMGAFDQLKKANKLTYQELICKTLRLPYARDELSLALTNSEREWGCELLQGAGWRPGEKLLGINLGGGGRWKKKQWKEEHFLALIHLVRSELGAAVLLIGGEHEAGMLTQFVSLGLSGVFSAGPKCSLRQTASLLSWCQVLLTGDSLAFHMAAALRIPTVVLLGPTSAAELDVYDRGEKIVAPIECVGCYLSDCDVEPDCMKRITPDQVFNAVRPWIQGPKPSTPDSKPHQA